MLMLGGVDCCIVADDEDEDRERLEEGHVGTLLLLLQLLADLLLVDIYVKLIYDISFSLLGAKCCLSLSLQRK